MPRLIVLIALVALGLFPGSALAQKRFVLAADPQLTADGLLKFILPRFSLKTGVRVTVEGPAAWPGAAMALGPDVTGAPVIEGPGGVIHAMALTEDPHARRFADWLASDVGQRTLLSFRLNGAPAYGPAKVTVAVVAEAEESGDPDLGETVSLRKCGRCHVVNEKNKYGGIGSTPSFGALRGLPRWRERFEAFFTLNPHPAFTQVEGVTEPFDPARPSPIAPLEVTLEEVDAILAFVQKMKPKDLGAPLAQN